MARVTYVGLGSGDATVTAFDALTPHVQQLLALQAECAFLGPDYAALGITLDALETAAFHFTRRRHFYHAIRDKVHRTPGGNSRLSDRAEARTAFLELLGYHQTLARLQRHCRPFGRDYLALQIALQGLETAAYHFTREASFYGARADSAGPTRPPL